VIHDHCTTKAQQKKLKQDFKKKLNTKDMDKKMYFNKSIEATKCNKKW
jgi:hypothetical protein